VSSKKGKKKQNKNKKKSILRLTFSAFSDRLFPVMRDRIELEEVFNTEELSVTEMAKIEHMDRVRRQAKAQANMFWFIQKRRQQHDWS
jgi:hypothetical protein